MPPYDLDERTFQFLCSVVTFVRTIRWEPGVNRIIEQLVDAAGSIGANRQEASSASSRKEFLRFSEISLRSSKESHFWLRACAAVRLGDQQLCAPLVNESDQLIRIFRSIVLSTKDGPQPG
jgi:four helix bundle protein